MFIVASNTTRFNANLFIFARFFFFILNMLTHTIVTGNNKVQK